MIWVQKIRSPPTEEISAVQRGDEGNKQRSAVQRLFEQVRYVRICINVVEMKEDYDVTGRTTYIQACKINGVIPVSYFLRNLQNPEVDMKHHGIAASGSKAIAIALVVNHLI